MYIVGFIDDDISLYEDYKKRLKRRDIDLLFADNCTSMQDIVNWILDNNIKCILVDYKLKSKYSFCGTDLVAYVNGELPDLPSVILTNYPEDSTNEKLVMQSLIIDRKILDQTDIDDFVLKIKQFVEVFDNRLKRHLEEFENLQKIKLEGTITATDEERYISLYKILRSYGEVDDIPIDLLKSDTNEKIDTLLAKLDKLIDSKDT